MALWKVNLMILKNQSFDTIFEGNEKSETKENRKEIHMKNQTKKVSNLYLSFCNNFRYIGEKFLEIKKEDNLRTKRRKKRKSRSKKSWTVEEEITLNRDWNMKIGFSWTGFSLFKNIQRKRFDR